MQLVVLISLIILAPINYLVFKGCVEPSHEEDEKSVEYVKPESWEVDYKKPKVMGYADEFLLKPTFIRSYHNRSKVLNVLKYHFEKAATMYEHGHHDDHGHDDHHGHHDDHNGHDDHHGHEEHNGHGKKHLEEKNGHNNEEEIEENKHQQESMNVSQLNATMEGEDDDFTL